jgi:hypothetical protein
MAIISLQSAKAAIPFSSPVPEKKQQAASGLSTTEEDSFTSTEKLRQTFETAQKQACTLEPQWKNFLESLLDEEDFPATPSTDKPTEKSVAQKVFGMLQAFSQNRKAVVSIVEEAQQKGLSKFQYSVFPNETPLTYEFTHLPEERLLSQYFDHQLKKIEEHSPDSEQFIKAVQAFVNNSLD